MSKENQPREVESESQKGKAMNKFKVGDKVFVHLYGKLFNGEIREVFSSEYYRVEYNIYDENDQWKNENVYDSQLFSNKNDFNKFLVKSNENKIKELEGEIVDIQEKIKKLQDKNEKLSKIIQ